MRVYEQGWVVVVSLPPETEVLSALTQLYTARVWPAAAVWGIGALHEIRLGYYRRRERKYHTWDLDGDWELVACHGTISTKEREPVLHLHVVVSNDRGETQGGHLVRGKVSAAGEFVVMPLPAALPRTYDDAVGLPLL